MADPKKSSARAAYELSERYGLFTNMSAERQGDFKWITSMMEENGKRWNDFTGRHPGLNKNFKRAKFITTAILVFAGPPGWGVLAAYAGVKAVKNGPRTVQGLISEAQKRQDIRDEVKKARDPNYVTAKELREQQAARTQSQTGPRMPGRPQPTQKRQPQRTQQTPGQSQTSQTPGQPNPTQTRATPQPTPATATAQTQSPPQPATERQPRVAQSTSAKPMPDPAILQAKLFDPLEGIRMAVAAREGVLNRGATKLLEGAKTANPDVNQDIVTARTKLRTSGRDASPRAVLSAIAEDPEMSGRFSSALNQKLRTTTDKMELKEYADTIDGISRMAPETSLMLAQAMQISTEVSPLAITGRETAGRELTGRELTSHETAGAEL